MIIALELLLIGIVLFLIGYPLFNRRADDFSLDSHRDAKKDQLLHKKENALLSLRELEEDYRSGKVSEDDYNELKPRFEAEAIAIMKELDGKPPAVSKGPAPGDERQAIYCHQCGTALKKGDKFCCNCGAKLRD